MPDSFYAKLTNCIPDALSARRFPGVGVHMESGGFCFRKEFLECSRRIFML
jgi:hypothetical protein